MPSMDAEPVFRGVIALELRNGTPPDRAALAVDAAGQIAERLGRDLAAQVPAVTGCELALLGAHFDPAEALRPGWPLHRRALELLQRAPGKAQGARIVGFGADARGEVPLPLQADPELTGGGLRVLPFVLRGDQVSTVTAALEERLLDHGMLSADTALAVQEALAAQIEHGRLLSLHDLLAMTALQYRNVGLDGLWSLLEAALLAPDSEYLLDAPPEPLARYVQGQVQIALLDPVAWRHRNQPDASDPQQLERGFKLFQMRQRQYAAVLQAHAVPVEFVHCRAGEAAALC